MFKNCSSMHKMKGICSTNIHRTHRKVKLYFSRAGVWGNDVATSQGLGQIRKGDMKESRENIKERILFLSLTGTYFEYCTCLIYT